VFGVLTVSRPCNAWTWKASSQRESDPYAGDTVWFKVKNGRYTQAEGRGDLFNRPRRE